MFWRNAFVVAGLGLLLTMPLPAQRVPFQPGAGLNGVDLLLQDDGVQKELKLSDEQIQKIKEVMREIRQKDRPQLEKLQDLSADERRAKVKSLMQKNSEEWIPPSGGYGPLWPLIRPSKSY